MSTRFLLLSMVGVLFAPYSDVCCQESDDEVIVRVKYFDLLSPLVRATRNELGKEYLELVESQNEQISDIISQFEEKAKIARDSDASPKTQLEKLEKLQTDLTKKVESILLPHQLNRIKAWSIYRSILEDGWANSVFKGSLALELRLDPAERESFKAKADEALTEYKERIVAAQQDALRKLKDALPPEKRTRLAELEELFFRDNTTLWPPYTFHLETDRRTRGTYLLKQ